MMTCHKSVETGIGAVARHGSESATILRIVKVKMCEFIIIWVKPNPNADPAAEARKRIKLSNSVLSSANSNFLLTELLESKKHKSFTRSRSHIKHRIATTGQSW
jgi:hypothetical protein